MRKVTQQIKSAFEHRRSLTVGNTRTDGESVWLFDNKIIKREGGEVFATLAGWNTPTTRERVNGITGVGFHQVKHEAMLNDRPVGTLEWINVAKEKARVWLEGQAKADFPNVNLVVEVI